MSMRQLNLLQTQDILKLAKSEGLEEAEVVSALKADNFWPTPEHKIKDFRQMEVNSSNASTVSKKVLNTVFHHYDVAQFALV